MTSAMRPSKEPVTLDETDRAIVARLREENANNVDLARELGVSEGTIRQRLKRLKDSGILKVAAGIDPDRPVIAYCTGGVRSAWAALVLSRAGVATANYDGSMWEWAADASLPMTDPSASTVAAPAKGASK